ncbi:MAG: HD domain-containing protein [Chitinivibrionales bacterium]|nr:HD domain-containing protein [Chitinivibrionales bacterium]MBD3358383.1 HD domain-containing protein [Chitinivibrionales bacterium]
MLVAQADESGVLHPLESLQMPVNLGKCTFTRGSIDQATIEECVAALRGFLRVLREYRLDRPGGRVRAVATSAVREASNRDAFIDRIYIATGIAVEIMDEAEENRFMFLSAKPYLDAPQKDGHKLTLIVEVGGGSTEMLVVRNGRVISSYSFRLGSFRMLGALEEYSRPDIEHLDLFETQIHRTISTVRRMVNFEGQPKLLALGGDLRFAAAELLPEWNRRVLARLPVSSLSRLSKRIIRESADSLVKQYRLSYTDAETLGPALLTNVRLATALGIKNIYVTPISMRDGVLSEMAGERRWSEEFREQIISSALELGRKYNFDQRHAEHVAGLALRIFGAMSEEHGLGPRHEVLLKTAGLLHEIGLYVGTRSHHKHSLYLIRNSNLFGLGPKDVLQTGLVARYHRRAMPQPTHEGYGTLDRESRIEVLKMAAILRVADALDRSATQRVHSLEITVEPRRLILTVRNVADLTLEQVAVERKSDLFGMVYGRDVVLRKGRAT